MSSSKNLTYVTNVVDGKTLHEIQSSVLSTLKNYLSNSFGPYGSTTIIKKGKTETIYTKDGHTILENIHFNGIVEEDVKDNIETITRHVVATVGDGTTSAVIISNLIFNDLLDLLDKGYIPKVILDTFESVVKELKVRILANSRKCEIDDIYDICMISTNGDEDLSKEIYQVYKKYGTNVFIDVSPSLSETTFLKVYDGMVLNTGLGDQYYVNNANNTCAIDNPEVYFFEHPIDTREMAVYLDAILEHNILSAIKSKDPSMYTPTVILAPNISQDLSAYMDYLSAAMENTEPANRPPLLILTGMHQVEELYDIADLCGAKQIRKYIDDNMRKMDIENGNAPTPETIFKWAGHCSKVESDTTKTKFVRPDNMYIGDTEEHSMMYKNRINFLEKELAASKERGDDAHAVGTLKRRINSLKSNMVEIFVGGISSSDRDSVRDLVEDAVLNCRSACVNGVGWGANFNTVLAITDMQDELKNTKTDELYANIVEIISNAYESVVKTLYKTASNKNSSVDYIYDKSIRHRGPINLRTNIFDDKVKCSIEGDIIILESISKIVGLMATSNQFILQNPVNNVYVDFD